MQCLYEQSGELYSAIECAEGVVQGDPVSSLAYSLAMQPLYEGAVAGAQVRSIAFIDDCYLMARWMRS